MHTQFKTRLNLESMEGREMPAGLLPTQDLATTALVVARPAVVVVESASPDKIALPTGNVVKRSLIGHTSTFTVTNETKNTVHFQIRWSSTEAWKSYSLPAGYRQSFGNYPLPGVGFIDGPSRPAQIRFDHSFRSGFQEKVYSLATKNEVGGLQSGRGTQYVFQPVTGGLNLFRR